MCQKEYAYLRLKMTDKIPVILKLGGWLESLGSFIQ